MEERREEGVIEEENRGLELWMELVLEKEERRKREVRREEEGRK